MPFFLKKKKQRKARRRNAIPPSLWLFYLGLISMSLTGVTFSKYSTVVQGTISVIVADSYLVSFLDDTGEEISSCRVYEGQQLHEADIPEISDKTVANDGSITATESNADLETDLGSETIKYKKFLGWRLDEETIVNPLEITVTGDLRFYAVYEVTENPILKATSSNAAETNPVSRTHAPVQTQPLETSPDAGQTTEAVPEAVPETTPNIEPVAVASSSNAAITE